MHAQLKLEDFQPYLNQPFQIHYDDQSPPLAAELIEVTALPYADGEVSRPPFSILLRSEDDTVLPQRIYRLSHEKMPQLDLFLVPVGPDQVGMRYEALFT